MTIKKWTLAGVGLVVLLVVAVTLTDHFYLPAVPYSRACKLLRQQRYEDAIEQFTIVLETDPTNSSALINRGVAHTRLGRHDRAIADYTAAIGLEPGTYVPYKNRASAYAERGDVTAAIADYEQYLRLSRDDPSEAGERRCVTERVRELHQRLDGSSVTAAGLTIEEHPIVAADVDTPSHFEFLDRISNDILARREEWRGLDAVRRVSTLNATLAPFGYHLVAEENAEWNRTFYDLYRGEELLLSDLSHIRPVAVNESGTDFAFVAENAPNERPMYLLISNSDVQPLDYNRFLNIPPVYLGDDLVAVENLDNYGQYAVRRGDEVLYTYTASGIIAGTHPVKRLQVWEGHWVLETIEGVFMDGESLTEQLGVGEIFHYVIFQNRPLFFFEQGGQVHISYGGETLPYTYDEVVHYRCCEPAVFNIGSNEHMLWFYALKDGTWYYVEIGVYDE